MEVIVAHEKHGAVVYGSALGLLADRVGDGYWYDNWDDGNPRHQWEDLAEKALASGDEATAWLFLMSRNDHEYEGVEEQTVR